MRIQHNIMAMNAYRNYTNNVSAMKKNLEKLSSGYKINRAGDDAAGLAISEKMRAQITGLETAQKNAKDGISLVQTAEGALTEVHDMLNRMVELATQSANGTYDNTTDRNQMQKEIDQLRSEINRIADSSNFNGIKLLDGTMDGGSKIGAATNIAIENKVDGDQDARTGNKPVYSFDLKDLKVLGDSSGMATVTNIVIGGATITLNFGATVADFKAEDLAATIVHVSGASLAIDGVSYSVAVKDGTKIELTAVSVPTTVASYATPVKVSVTMATNSSNNNSFDVSVHVKEAPQAPELPKVAQGQFTLDTDQIKDGTQLTIGKDTYTFKVGKDSTVSGSNIIDLSDYEEGQAGLARQAGILLSRQTNSMFDINTSTLQNNANTTRIGLTEKVGAIDYKKDWDLKGNAVGDSNGVWEHTSGTTDGVGVVRIAQMEAGKGTSLTLQIGDTADSFNQLKVNIGDTHCDSLGIDKISIASQADAATAVDKIKAAINQVSDIRGTLGATQNRLDHTINNLGVMTENIQDAESTIRDTDVAEEMMAYTKNNILIQSAQAMLAQANQVPQGVLQLLG